MIFNSEKKLVVLPLGISLLLFSFLLALLPSDSAADTYKWVDAGGIIHISDNPPDIPPAYRKNVQIVKDHQEQSKGSTSIPFERAPSGLIVVDAVLNGSVRTKMVFDTGADIVVITEKLARKLNQDITGGEEITLHTNCGDITGQTFALNKIELGPVSKRNVRSVVAPVEASLSGYDGLLGLSFLGAFKITVDYKKGKIMIGREE
jgi:clan AA aspartic protease (TIGR02281 family)